MHLRALRRRARRAPRQADRWIAETSLRLASLAPVERAELGRRPARAAASRFRLSRSHEQYLEDIATCKQRLIEGETYEICLTNKITAEVERRSAARSTARCAGSTRRRSRPTCASATSAVLSSSPERFLSVGRDRWVEAKPIKGTCPRGATPAEDVRLAEQLRLDEKSRAENLMIADLLRNDLGVVCEVGTVHVPDLMHVETYETVHQLVSTVRGLLREDVEPPDCIRACFPGGSMTGAPKKRTMEIIDELEGEARGVYSGAIGYLGLERRLRPEHRDPHDRARGRAREPRRRRRDRDAVRRRGGVPGDAAEGARADGRDRPARGPA